MHWEQKKNKKRTFFKSAQGQVNNLVTCRTSTKKQTKSQTHSDIKNQNEVRVTDPHLLPTSPLILYINHYDTIFEIHSLQIPVHIK